MKKVISIFSLLCFVTLLLFLFSFVKTEDDLSALTPCERNTISVYKATKDGVVHIDCIKIYQSSKNSKSVHAVGSGFFFDRSGHILTNFHLIENAYSLFVVDSFGKKYNAKIVGTDPATDVAILKIEGKKDIKPLKLGDSDHLLIGQKVLAIGNPYGLDNTLTVGVISALNRSLPNPSLELSRNVIQTDAAVNPGSSGGPLIDSKGEVIGINTAMVGEGAQNIGFAIPINVVKRIIPQLLEKGHSTRPWLGFTGMEIDERLARLFGIKVTHGVLVEQVVPGSPAWEAGIRAGEKVIPFGEDTIVLGGDIICGMNGEPVEKVIDIVSRLSRLNPGEKVIFDILRDGKKIKIAVTLGTFPSQRREGVFKRY